MPVDTRHAEYEAIEPVWNRIRDVLSGHDAMVRGGSKYLPSLSGQTMEMYSAYQNRAPFHDATSRTVDGLLGAVFRRPPRVDIPESFMDVRDRFTVRGVSVDVFTKQVVREVVELGRYGVLTDVGPDGGEPYTVGYRGEDIVNWREEAIDGIPTLVLVVLREVVQEPDPDDRYVLEPVEHYRVLELVEGVYTQTLFRVDERDAMVTGRREDKFIPVFGPQPITRRGAALGFIPFQFFGPDHLQTRISKSPIYGLSLANIGHWQTSADLKHGAHFTALPTPVIAGEFQGEGTPTLQIGAGVGWKLQEGARWGMLEFSGAGLGSVRQIREDEKRDMAVLGARLLEDQKVEAEAVGTVMMRHRGENSVLANIADTVGRGMSTVLSWVVWWSGGAESAATVLLNTDFVDRALIPQEMVALVAGWQQGGYGGEVLFHNLRDGERLPDGMTFDEWQADIEAHGPDAAFLGDLAGEDDDAAADAAGMDLPAADGRAAV